MPNEPPSTIPIESVACQLSPRARAGFADMNISCFASVMMKPKRERARETENETNKLKTRRAKPETGLKNKKKEQQLLFFVRI
jgi:hypothetical protein